jgi:hypothetical protein
MQTMKSSSISAGQPETKVKNRSTRTNGESTPATGETSTWSQPSHEQIARLASQLYIESGCQEGRDAENWLRAEEILRHQTEGQVASGRPQPERKSGNGSKQRSARQQF